MRRFFKLAMGLAKGLCLASLLGGASTAIAAANVQFVGSVGYSLAAPFVILNADQIKNSGTSPSGQLHLELWATQAPFSGSITSGYKLAQYALGALNAGASLASVSSGLVAWTGPPAGKWYVAMVLTEFTGGSANGGYTVDDYLKFPDTINGSGPPPADTTPPAVSITSPGGGNVSGSVSISANASDNVGVSRVDFYVNGVLLASDPAAPYQVAWDSTKVANGSATLRATAFDAAGNSANSANVTVTVANAPPADTTPPVVSITSPGGGNVSGSVSISANASDNVGVSRVDFYVNGVLLASDPAAPYQATWDSTKVANGSATLRATAFDAAGNSANSANVTVTVANAPPADTTPPVVSITSPGGGNVSGSVSISANASDNIGVSRVDFYVNGVLLASDPAAPYQVAWDSTKVANGSATLRATAFDAAGNSANSANVTVTVANAPPADTTPPAVSITSPGGGNVSGSVSISANASDNVGVSRVDFYVNGVLLASDPSAPYQATWDSTKVANGAATLRATAFDAAGNSANSANVTVTVANNTPPPGDTVPPTVLLTYPMSGQVSGIVNIAANASDNVGVTRVEFLVNGSLVASDSLAPFQVNWDSRTAADGAAELHAIAYDAAGNSGVSASVMLTVANSSSPPPPPRPRPVPAVEYYNNVLDHYFLTASQMEIDALDSGQFYGWSRTGLAINVYAEATGSANPVCRIYLPPSFGDSHFYSASPQECAETMDKFPWFKLESADVFYANLPDPVSGGCIAGTVPVYRVWNKRVDTNHRYMTSRALRDQMVANGGIAEGAGPDAVIMCSPN